jgi:hypothetical protein
MTTKTVIGAIVLALALVGCDGGDGPAGTNQGAAGSAAAGTSGAAGDGAAAGTGGTTGSAGSEAGTTDPSGASGAGAAGTKGQGGAGGTTGGGGTTGAAGTGAASYPECPAMTDDSDCYSPALQRQRKKDGYTCAVCTAPHVTNPIGCVTTGNFVFLCVRDCSECS